MTVRSIPATKLESGMVLALPMGKIGTVSEMRVGRRFVWFKTDEYGQSRVEKNDEVLIEVDE